MSPALSLSDVCKRYGRREPWVLDRFSCQIPRGSISGLIGPNGAGKTTLFSVVGGFLIPDSGEVDILGGGGFDPQRLKGRLGILPQDAQLPARTTSRRFLTHLARLQGMSALASGRSVDRVLGGVGLLDRAEQDIGALSHGMRRRVAVASALLGTPELVLLDEPTAGLDPAQGRRLRTLLRDLGGDTTLLISSHNLDELERICDHVVFIENGHCVREGSIRALTARDQRVTWGLAPGELPLEQLRSALPDHGFELIASGELRLLQQTAPTTGDIDSSAVVIAAILASAGIAIRSLRRGVSLEERYIEDQG